MQKVLADDSLTLELCHAFWLLSKVVVLVRNRTTIHMINLVDSVLFLSLCLQRWKVWYGTARSNLRGIMMMSLFRQFFMIYRFNVVKLQDFNSCVEAFDLIVFCKSLNIKNFAFLFVAYTPIDLLVLLTLIFVRTLDVNRNFRRLDSDHDRWTHMRFWTVDTFRFW